MKSNTKPDQVACNVESKAFAAAQAQSDLIQSGVAGAAKNAGQATSHKETPLAAIGKVNGRDIAELSRSAPWMNGEQTRDVKVAQALAVVKVIETLGSVGQHAVSETQTTKRAQLLAKRERRELDAWSAECAANRRERMALSDRLPAEADTLLRALETIGQLQIASGAQRPSRKQG